jgi:SAM-dependent methyltransferase
MLVIEKYYPNWRDAAIHESSPSKRDVSLLLQKNCKRYVSSQFYPNKPFGSMIRGDRNENLEAQTFQDSIFDLVITQDVFEHLYSPDKGFAEVARTLKPGGRHIFTVPIVNKNAPTEVWAVKGKHGEPIFLKTEDWHMNPIDLKGSPATMHWGYDIVDYIKKNSGLNTIIEYVDNPELGIQSEPMLVFVSQKD